MHEALAYLPQILPAYVAYLIAVISPGPAIMAIVSTSMTRGRKAGMTISLGIFAGSLTWACAAALGLATLLQTYAMALEILKVLGGIYLLYLANKAFRSLRSGDDLPIAQTIKSATTKSLILRGYGIHVIASMLRWNDIRIANQSMFGSRIELRLNDPGDSSIERKLSETLGPDSSGRALTDGKLFAPSVTP